MRRRQLIALLGAAVAWPLAARAQQPSGKVWRIAVLYPGSWENAADQAPFNAFREGLQTPGYIDGKNIVIDRQGADGQSELGPDIEAYVQIRLGRCRRPGGGFELQLGDARPAVGEQHMPIRKNNVS